jgi:hypothetical protein
MFVNDHPYSSYAWCEYAIVLVTGLALFNLVGSMSILACPLMLTGHVNFVSMYVVSFCYFKYVILSSSFYRTHVALWHENDRVQL